MRDQKLPSERSFGILFAAVFALLAVNELRKGGDSISVLPFAACSALLLLFAAGRPKALAPLNMVWFRFGTMLGRIVSPIVIGLIFFLLITPVALITRFLGRDPLRLNSKEAGSYWIERSPPGPAPESFRNQF